MSSTITARLNRSLGLTKRCKHCLYQIEKGRDGRTYLLACHKCNHFYGYVMTEKDANFWKNIIKRDGVIDMEKVRWRETDYTQKFSDNQKAKKVVPYNPQTDTLEAPCGHKFIGSKCPTCGVERVVRRVQKARRR